MVRNALWRRVELAARDDVAGLADLERTASELAEPPLEVTMARADWDAALERYYAEHDAIRLDADARGPALFAVSEEGRRWTVRQTLHDPDGHHDWVVDAVVDLDTSDLTGEAVVLATAMHRLGG